MQAHVNMFYLMQASVRLLHVCTGDYESGLAQSKIKRNEFITYPNYVGNSVVKQISVRAYFYNCKYLETNNICFTPLL